MAGASGSGRKNALNKIRRFLRKGDNMAARKGGLGKGLDALFVENTSETGNSALMLKISEIEPNRLQPRKSFDQSALEELADSLREVGVIQPLIVRPVAAGGYQIVAGERRWRAAQMAGLTEVPAIVRELTDREVDEMALIENLQREDLDAIEEAEGYRHLIEEYSMTQEQVASRVGKSRPAVSNSMRLLELPDGVLQLIRRGELTAGHARALLTLPTDDDKLRLGTAAARKGMSVREVEKLVKTEKQKSEKKPAAKPKQRDSIYDEVQLALCEELHRRVKISGSNGKGTLEIDFYSVEELCDIANRLGGRKGTW